MPFTNFTPKTRTQEAQDAKSFRIWDESVWSAESHLCDSAVLQVSYYDTFGVLKVSLEYDLITGGVGGDKTKFNEYLSSDGHKIEIADLFASLTRFPDGYYIIRVTYNDGTYVAPNEPYYDDHQAFLAKVRCMSRKMPLVVLPWPEMNKEEILDTHKVTLLLDAAEDSADLGKRMLFDRLIRTLNRIFDQYSITECF